MMSINVPITAIRELQGESLNSPFAGQQVTTTGVVTGMNGKRQKERN